MYMYSVHVHAYVQVLHIFTSVCAVYLGYQYGRVPWGDADITCLVDENGTPKFCLQELCGKVHMHVHDTMFVHVHCT